MIPPRGATDGKTVSWLNALDRETNQWVAGKVLNILQAGGIKFTYCKSNSKLLADLYVYYL